MSNRRNKLKTYKGRKINRRQQSDVILIICVGETEKLYFEQFNLTLGEIRVKAVRDARSPSQLVRRAVTERDSENYSQVWCVFDRDDFADYDEAILLANKHNIKVAYSNQAFEIWYILHFDKITGACHRNQYARRLSAYLGSQYTKTDSSIFKTLRPLTEEAIRNAKWGYEVQKRDRGSRPSNWESSTNVFELVEELKKWIT